jgi:hypothetical protein
MDDKKQSALVAQNKSLHEEVIFLLEQLNLLEHYQDHNKITELWKKYKVGTYAYLRKK